MSPLSRGRCHEARGGITVLQFGVRICARADRHEVQMVIPALPAVTNALALHPAWNACCGMFFRAQLWVLLEEGSCEFRSEIAPSGLRFGRASLPQARISVRKPTLGLMQSPCKTGLVVPMIVQIRPLSANFGAGFRPPSGLRNAPTRLSGSFPRDDFDLVCVCVWHHVVTHYRPPPAPTCTGATASSPPLGASTASAGARAAARPSP